MAKKKSTWIVQIAPNHSDVEGLTVVQQTEYEWITVNYNLPQLLR